MDTSRGGLAELYHYLATSEGALPQAVRRLKKGVLSLSIPVPRAVVWPLVKGHFAAQAVRDFGARVFVAQPVFRALCKECGPGLRTDRYIHGVRGQGDIVLGSNVCLDGRSIIIFASRFATRPVLAIGDGSAVGDGTHFTVGKRITIGKNCNISGHTLIFDSSGHSTDPVARRSRRPPPADEVRPVTIGDDVWIGKNCIVFPGVRIGDCAVVSAGSVVRRHVPPYAVVAGNPAQVIFRLPRPAESARVSEPAAPA
jgi:acetyltransferase-like isoleucine patch superfamily enzyme